MDISQWNNRAFETINEFSIFASVLESDLRAQLEKVGLVFLKQLPNPYLFGAIATTPEKDKWIHITLPDVRKQPDWAHNTCLRRMSSERDWKGEAFHYCNWEEVGTKALQYMDSAYDNEIL